jgi:hypothetical protein
VHNGVAIGGGVQVFFNTIGEITAYVDPAGNVQTLVGEELLATYSATAGLLFRPGEYWDAVAGLSFGFVFRDETYTRYHIPVYAQLDQIPFIVNFDAVSLFTPRQYVAAVAYRFGDWLVEVDGSYNEWRRFPDPNLQIDVDVEIPVVPIDFQNSVEHPPHFHDTITARAGIEARAYKHRDLDLFARAGYSYDPSPVPPQRRYTNLLDTDRHSGAVSLGVKWFGVKNTRFDGSIDVDVFYQCQYLPRRVFYKDDDVDPDNPGYPKIGLEGWLHFVGVSMSAFFDYE